MKALLLTLTLLLSLTTMASAQKKDKYAEMPGNETVTEARVGELTRQMCNQLHLNEAQYIRLREANRIKLARLDEIQWQYKTDLTQQHTKIAELEAQYEAECSRILTPSQLSMYRSQQQHDDVPAQPASNEGGVG
jgi:outer membrane lipopolysaccharide assembly protein LptE/RlpB